MGFFPEEAGGCIRTFSPRGKYFVGALLPAVRFEFKLFTNRPPLEYAIIRVQWPTVGCSPDNLINFFTCFFLNLKVRYRKNVGKGFFQVK